MPLGSHDAYKRDMASEPWFEKARVRPDVYEEQEDQWAILRHEVEGEDMQRRLERVRSDTGQRDTEEDTISSQSSFDALMQATQTVDIVVAGVGGGGMNAINRMIEANVRGVRFVAMNTDAQVLGFSQSPSRICLGQHHTKGLGAGGNAAVGMRAATESTAEIRAALGDADLVFIAAGMGGGTGTGAAPVVASIAKKLGLYYRHCDNPIQIRRVTPSTHCRARHLGTMRRDRCPDHRSQRSLIDYRQPRTQPIRGL